VHKLKFRNFTSKETSDGKTYIEFNERDTRSGATKESRAFKPKMWSIIHCTQRDAQYESSIAF